MSPSNASRPPPHGWAVETAGSGTLQARAVIIATQPHVAAGLPEPVDETGARAAAQISAPAINAVFVGYRRDQVKHPLDSLGFLSVRDPSHVLTGAQFCSTLFEGRAPESHVAICGYVGGARNTDAAGLPPPQLINEVHGELASLLGISGEPVVARCRQWARGLPQYRVGHQQLAQRLETIPDRTTGLFVCGNYLSGISVANCIARSKDVARRTAGFLGAISLRKVPDRDRVPARVKR